MKRKLRAMAQADHVSTRFPGPLWGMAVHRDFPGGAGSARRRCSGDLSKPYVPERPMCERPVSSSTRSRRPGARSACCSSLASAATVVHPLGGTSRSSGGEVPVDVATGVRIRPRVDPEITARLDGIRVSPWSDCALREAWGRFCACRHVKRKRAGDRVEPVRHIRELDHRLGRHPALPPNTHKRAPPTPVHPSACSRASQRKVEGSQENATGEEAQHIDHLGR